MVGEPAVGGASSASLANAGALRLVCAVAAEETNALASAAALQNFEPKLIKCHLPEFGGQALWLTPCLTLIYFVPL